MDFLKFFKGIGHHLLVAMKLMRESVPDPVIERAKELAKQAEAKFLDNASRREWVIQQLMAIFRVPEWAARVATEYGVRIFKEETGKLIDQAGDLGKHPLPADSI